MVHFADQIQVRKLSEEKRRDYDLSGSGMSSDDTLFDDEDLGDESPRTVALSFACDYDITTGEALTQVESHSALLSKKVVTALL